MQFRQDTTPILKSQETSNGHLRIYGRIGRADYPLKYINQDGTTRTEIIKPEHLFSKETLDSFKMVPVTKGHPPEILNSDNTTKYLKGMTGHHLIVENNEFLGIVATLVDRDLINSVKDGTYSQISPGYSTTLIQGDGTDESPYWQGGRIANHVSACRAGRHGPEVSFQLDSTNNELWINAEPDIYKAGFDEEYVTSILNRFDGSNQNVFTKSIIDLSNTLSTIVNSKGATMPTSIPVGKRVFNVDGTDGPELASSVVDLLTRIDSLEAEKASANTELSAVKSELASTKNEASRLDGLLEVTTEKLNESEKRPVFNADAQATEMAEQMAERIELWSTVLPAIRKDGAEDFKPDFKLDSVNIQRLYLLSQKPELKDNARFNSDSGYVSGLYDALKDAPAKVESADSEETRADEQENISMSLLSMIEAARKDSAETVEGERADMGMAGGVNYAGGSKEKESPIAKKRRERSMKPVTSKEAM